MTNLGRKWMETGWSGTKPAILADKLLADQVVACHESGDGARVPYILEHRPDQAHAMNSAVFPRWRRFASGLPS